jgi:hypothetical protein
MTNIQSMLALGAMVLLTITSLRFNGGLLESTTAEIENKVYLTAFSLADDLIEEMKNKPFDAATINVALASLSALTPPSSFGKKTANELDIDDYHNYSKLVSAPHAEDYLVTCVVEYVMANNQNVVSTTATFYKRATVTVNSPFLRLPVNLSFIFSLK